jgi:hypothetical protein
MGNRERKVESLARPSKLWRALVAGGIALAAACAGMQKSGDSGSTGSSGSSGTSGDSGGVSGGNAGGAGGW